jgi:hypothetical protein
LLRIIRAGLANASQSRSVPIKRRRDFRFADTAVESHLATSEENPPQYRLYSLEIAAETMATKSGHNGFQDIEKLR